MSILLVSGTPARNSTSTALPGAQIRNLSPQALSMLPGIYVTDSQVTVLAEGEGLPPANWWGRSVEILRSTV